MGKWGLEITLFGVVMLVIGGYLFGQQAKFDHEMAMKRLEISMGCVKQRNEDE